MDMEGGNSTLEKEQWETIAEERRLVFSKGSVPYLVIQY